MLILKNLYLRPEIGGVSSFSCRLFNSRSKWNFSCCSMCDNALDLTGMHDWRFQAERKYQGFRDKAQIPGLMETKLMNGKSPKMFSHVSDYDNVMEALSSLITRKKRGDKSPAGASTKMKLERMLMYVKILGLEEHIADLKIIHVAGTKGKGSTCAFCEAILRQCGFRTGLFTSPHLIDVRERFRLDGNDISEEKFLHYFKECWHELKKYESDELPMPRLFEFLTVMALKIFVSEKVDVAIIEVGLGGARDSTNVINNPIVCGVTPLGMDHMESLGDTLGKIASQKAGIFKYLVPAFTVPQLSEAMDALKEKATELKAPLEVVSPLDRKMLNGTQLSLSGDHQYTNAGLAVALCRKWLQSTGNWEKLFHHDDRGNKMPEAFLNGLSSARLPGRGQIVYDSVSTSRNTSLENESSSGDLIFYLDGAHSPESMEACARWFSSVVRDDRDSQPVPSSGSEFHNGRDVWSNGHMKRRKDDSEKISKQILLFNCMDVRDPKILLSKLVNTCASSGTCFSNAIFVPSISTYNKVTSGSSTISLDIPAKDLTWQRNLQEVWEKMIHDNDSDVPCKRLEMKSYDKTPPQTFFDEDFACSAVVSSLPSTINWLRNYVQENPSVRIQVLVTGSLHLVGDVLKVLKR